MKTRAIPTAPARRRVVLVLVALTGCGGNEGGPARDELEYALFESTVLLDENTLPKLVEVTADGTLRFDGVPEALAGLRRLSVVLAPASPTTPSGLLRLVSSVQEDGNGLVVNTVPAPLQLAFRKLHVRVTRSVDTASDSAPWQDPGRGQPLSYTGQYWPQRSFDEYPINGDGDISTPFDQVRIHGEVEAGFTYTIGVDVDWGEVFSVPNKVLDCIEEAVKLSFSCDPTSFLPEAEVYFAIDAGATVALALEGITFLPYSQEHLLAEKGLPEVPIGPLMFKPRVEIIAQVQGEASSAFSISARAQSSAQASVRVSSKTGPHLDTPTFDRAFEAPAVFATLSARGRVAVGPRLHVRLYDFAGPYASLFVFAEVEADSQQDPCWRLTGGVSGDLGLDVVTPDLPVVGHLTLAEFGPIEYGVASAEVDSGACEPLTTGPGGGQAGPPDQTSYAQPSFTPWAVSYGGVVDGFPFEGPGAQLEWSQVTPTIDGRFMLTGSDTKALIKLGTDGAAIWARRFVADVPFWQDTLIPDLLPGRVVNADDGGMLVVAHPYTFLKVGADGDLKWARRLAVPAYRETWLRLSAATSDGEGGYYVAGTYGEHVLDATTSADAWVMRLSPAGDILWSKRIGGPAEGNMVRSIVAFEGGVVVSGSTWSQARALWSPFVYRLDRQGSLRFAEGLAVDDCQGGDDRGGHLIDSLLTQDGDLLFAYHGTHQGNVSGLVRLKPDGTFAWSSQFGAGAANELGPVVTGLVELPLGGYVAAGTYSGAQTASDWWLAGLDALGRPTWAQRLGAIDVPESTGRDEDGYPSLVLTNDGGLILGGYGEAHAYPQDALVVMKVFAKDGHIDFAPGAEVAAHPLELTQRSACVSVYPTNLEARELAVPLAPLTVQVQALDLTPRLLGP